MVFFSCRIWFGTVWALARTIFESKSNRIDVNTRWECSRELFYPGVRSSSELEYSSNKIS